MNKNVAKFFVNNSDTISVIINNGATVHYDSYEFNKNNVDFCLKNLNVIQDYVNGKTIQARKNKYCKWKDEDCNDAFQYLDYEYRVKPEPRRFKIAVNKNNQICGIGFESLPEGFNIPKNMGDLIGFGFGFGFGSFSEGLKFQMPNMDEISFIDVQEVID
jgi:hypothetical protein